MPNDPCNCCNPPPSSPPVIESISAGAECYRCGITVPFPDYDVPGISWQDRWEKYASVKTHTEGNSSTTDSGLGGNASNSKSSNATYRRFFSQNPDGTCAPVESSSNSTFSSQEQSSGYSKSINGSCSKSRSPASGSGSGTATTTVNHTPHQSGDGTSTGPANCGIYGGGAFYPSTTTYTPTVITESSSIAINTPIAGGTRSGNRSGRTTTTYQNPVPDCNMVFSEYPDWTMAVTNPVSSVHSGTTPSAGYFSPDGADKFKWRLRHGPIGTCYLKVWLAKVSFLNDGSYGPITVTPLPSYVWQRSGNPCLNSPNLPPDDPLNEIFGPIEEVDERAVRGLYTYVNILKFSYLPDYEPDISDPLNKQPNGLPNIHWSPGAP